MRFQAQPEPKPISALKDVTRVAAGPAHCIAGMFWSQLAYIIIASISTREQ
jgi:hypothetical protein